MRLTIFSRLMLGYLVLLGLTVGVSIYSILQLGRVGEVAQSIILRDNALLDLHKNMADAILSEARYEKKFAIMRDRALYEGFLDANQTFTRYLQEAVAFADSKALQELFSRLGDRHEVYQELVAEEMAALKAGSPLPGERYREAKERVVNEALAELAELRTMSQQSIFSKIRNLDEAGARASTVAQVITAIALLFGLLLAVSTTASITVPLSRMKKKTGEIAKGVFAADLTVASPPEIGALAQAFNSMCTQLREVDRMKSDFYSLMSHELRTPLTSIREGINLFREDLGSGTTEKQRQLLAILAEESDRLIALVSSLLDLSKLEAGMVTFSLTPADLPSLVAQTVREVAPLAQSKNISIESEVREIPPVAADAERILQVMRNLIGNALKFTPRGGAVRIAVDRTEDGVRVSVADTGPGIPAEQIDLIFEKFRQAPRPGSRRVQGTGLGLAIVKHIIEAHGGKVWVESEVGRGSSFAFVLPV